MKESAGGTACPTFYFGPCIWFQKMNVPRSVEVMMSGAPSWLRSTAMKWEPTPERLWISSGTNSAPPGALDCEPFGTSRGRRGRRDRDRYKLSWCDQYALAHDEVRDAVAIEIGR